DGFRSLAKKSGGKVHLRVNEAEAAGNRGVPIRELAGEACWALGGGIDREDGRVSMAQAGDRRTIRICRMDVGRALAAQPFRSASRRDEGQGREAGIDMQDQERKIRRFDLFWLNLDPTVGAETRGTRPCLIVSPDAANEKKQIVSIAPITSYLAKVGDSGV